MGPSYTRAHLEGLKRADLQKLCKDYGVKANLKSETLIDLIMSASTQPVASGSRTTFGPPSSASTSAIPGEPRPRKASRAASRARTGSVIIHSEAEEQEEATEVKEEPELQSARAPLRRASSALRQSSRSGTRSRDRSGATVIIHDEDEESEPDLEPEPALPAALPEVAPPPRARKAKDTQLRLGVGRPVTAGGSGARAVTKSASLGKSKRGRSMVSVRSMEPTIEEEPEFSEQDAEEGQTGQDNRFKTGASGHDHDPERPSQLYGSDTMTLSGTQASLINTLEDDLAKLLPLEGTVRSLVLTVHDLTTRMDRQTERITRLEAEVVELKSRRPTSSHAAPLNISVPPPGQWLLDPSSLVTPIQTHATAPFPTVPPTPGASLLSSARKIYPTSLGKAKAPAIIPTVAPSALGKRRRDSESDEVSGVYDVGQEDQLEEEDLEKQVPRPVKKRPRLSSSGPEAESPHAGSSGLPGPHVEDPLTPDNDENDENSVWVPAPGPPRPTFTVFTGPDEPPIDTTPPPTMHLPQSYATQTAGAGGSGSNPNGNTVRQENQQPSFNFAFDSLPAPSTPGGFMGAPLAYLARPTSPSPSPGRPGPPPGPIPRSLVPSGRSYGHIIERAGGRRERNDLFRPFGSPPPTPGEPDAEGAGPSGGGGGGSDDNSNGPFLATALELRPASPRPLVLARPQTGPSSNEVGAGLGMAALPGPDSPAVPMRRTMYGTELEGDTRFGDFGVEGIAHGAFWTGGSKY